LRPTAVDLFCGAGGLSLGLRWAGFEIVAANDYDPDSCATFRANHPEASVTCGDIENNVVMGAVIDSARRHGSIDLVVGGPPCQGFSQMRNFSRFIDDPRNHLYKRFVSVIRELRPRAFLMENVPGLRELNGVAAQIVDDLSLRGDYEVAQPQVLEAADFGVPQSRRRLFFVGIRRDLGNLPEFPRGRPLFAAVDLVRRFKRKYATYTVEPRSSQNGTASLDAGTLRRLLDPEDLEFVTVRQAIGDLEGLAPGEGTPKMARLAPAFSAYQRLMADSEFLLNHDVPRMNRDTILRLRTIPPGGNFLDIRESYTARYITGQRWGPDLGRKRLSRQHYYAYRKLHPDFVSWTVNTKADFAYHYQRAPRAVTVREAARIQSFPDSYEFLTDEQAIEERLYGGRRHSLYRQVGNAVPPLLAKAIGETLRVALEVAPPEAAMVGA
jgi:DNA (cytosine-5)-methyltransferase 1